MDEYRRGIVAVVVNAQGKLLMAKRSDKTQGWQFVQGGLERGESIQDGFWRELTEEVGYIREDVEYSQIVTNSWIKYDFPTEVSAGKSIKGQQQVWGIVVLKDALSEPDLDTVSAQEFDEIRWVNFWFPITAVVSFKQSAYRMGLNLITPHYNRYFYH